MDQDLTQEQKAAVQYNAIKKEVGKDALKALFLFFIVLPGFVVGIMFTNAYGLKFLLPTTLGLAGILWLIKKVKH